MSRNQRDRSYIRIKFGIIDIDAADTSVITDNGHLFYSNTDMLVFDEVPQKTYATFEKNRMKADGKLLVPSNKFPLKQGYVSSQLTNDEGIFTKQPCLDINFSKKHSCPALTFVFDASMEEYPQELEIVVYRGNSIIEKLICTPNYFNYVFYHEFLNFDRLLIIYKRSKPYYRARLQQIIFGVGIVFTNKEIQSASQIVDIDPINRRLEENTFDFTIMNEQGIYNPDNPQGVWEYIEGMQPVNVEYGQRIKTGLTWADLYTQTWDNVELTDWKTIYEGGTIEWIKGGRYVLTGRPEVKQLTATFSARSGLMALVNPYHKGQYRPQGITLYDIALEILLDADIPNIFYDRPPYILHSGLKNLTTVAPIPKTSHREALQLIANAAGMIAYTDRDGIIRIEPISKAAQDFDMDYNETLGWQIVTKIPPLARVDVDVYSYKPASELRELHKGNYSKGSHLVEFEFATDITVSGASSYTALSGSVSFTVTTPGEVVISGYPIETSISKVRVTTGIEGETELIENVLITNSQAAQNLANVVKDYLRLRNTYEFEYRGRPEVDGTDIVNLQSKYDKDFPGRMLKHQIEFDGALKGQVIMKRM